MIRSVTAGLLLLFAGILAIGANLVVWANRTVFDSDRFVATVDPVLRDKDVQVVISQRLTEELFAEADVQNRIKEELPPRLTFLSQPFTTQAQQLVVDAVVRVLQAKLVGDLSERLIREVHTQLIAIIEEDQSAGVTRQGNQLVINLQPLLQSAADELGLDKEGQIGQRIDIPPDRGQIVLAEGPGTYTWVADLVKQHRAITATILAVTGVMFGLAVLASRDRRATIRNAGIVLVAAALISLVALFVGKEVTASYARNPTVARDVLDSLLRGVQYQSLVMLALGAVVACGAALAGSSRTAVEFRAMFRRSNRGRRAELAQSFIRDQKALLRLGGFAVAALVLVAWPEPTARVYAITIALLVAYLGGIAIISSTAPWANSTRTRIRDTWSRYFAANGSSGSFRAWVSAHANLLRVLGIIAAALFLMLWPDLTMRRLVVVLALTFVYLGAIDWAGRVAEPTHPVRT
jgi:hypothetical protein